MKNILVSLGIGSSLILGADASVFTGEPVADQVVQLKEETVEVKQIENVVEATFPWKDQLGLKVTYDLKEPTLEEQIKDKRNIEVITEQVNTRSKEIETEIATLEARKLELSTPIGEEDGAPYYDPEYYEIVQKVAERTSELSTSDGYKVDLILNEKPDTNKFCYAIEGHENYDFFYQRKLSEIQGELPYILNRPPEIEGSYAVYHKSLKNNGYQTGKVMHIPRPQVWSLSDEATKVWADMSYDVVEGLCVTVPQEFLDKAEYPVRVDPTFGYTSLGASENGWNSDTIQCDTPSAASEAGYAYNVNVGAFKNTAGSSNWSIIGGMYDASGNLITGSTASTSVNSTSRAWRTALITDTDLISFDAEAADTCIILDYAGASAWVAHDDTVGVTNGKYENSIVTYPTFLSDQTNLADLEIRASIYFDYVSQTSGGQVTIPYTTTGTDYWTAPSVITQVDAACWGAGGGGGDGTGAGAGGGGGGAFASATVPVIAGTTYTVVVGAGGSGATVGAGNGVQGGNSTFSTTSVIAAGGSAGFGANVADSSGGAGGSTTTSSGTVEYRGGNGGGGKNTDDVGGGGGAGAGPSGEGGDGAAGGATAGQGGGGGGGNGGNDATSSTGGSSTNGGAGGNGGNAGAGAPGTANTNGGGGGGGGDDLNAGGNGATIGAGGGGGETNSTVGTGDGQNGKCTLTYTIASGGGGGGGDGSIFDDILWFN